MAEATDSQNERTRRAKQSMTAYTVQRGEFTGTSSQEHNVGGYETILLYISEAITSGTYTVQVAPELGGTYQAAKVTGTGAAMAIIAGTAGHFDLTNLAPEIKAAPFIKITTTTAMAGLFNYVIMAR